ncbi:MAG: hypothetical protein ACR2N9_09045 [Acidimicrobiia bacterium]
MHRPNQGRTRTRIAAASMVIALLAASCADDSDPPDASATTEPTRETGAETTTSPPTSVEPAGDYDEFGGLRALAFEATGRFRVEQGDDGRWWLITPDGHAFWSHGLQGVTSTGTPEGDSVFPYETNILERHGSKEAWADNTLQLMDRAGFNTIGDFSEIEFFEGDLPYVTGVFLNHHAPRVERGPDAFRGRAADFFHPDFEAGVLTDMETVRQCGADPHCIGVFLDDEISWAASFLMPIPYFDSYQWLEPGAPGKEALQQFLEERYDGEIAGFNETWGTSLESFDEIQTVDPEVAPLSDAAAEAGTPAQQSDRFAFRTAVAERFFSVAGEAFDDAGPDVLNLCPRALPGNLTADVIDVAARSCDVISINAFDVPQVALDFIGQYAWTGAIQPDPLFSDVPEIATIADRPILLSSFSYRAEVEGLNDFPPTFIFEILPTQQDRADRYEQYMIGALAEPTVIGAHWFIHSDQPAAGRWDGENSNFGIVDITDEPYEVLVDRMTAVASGIYE